MGIDVRLEDEDGNEEKSVLDPGFDLEKLLPSIEDETSYCLRFIDPYGDTVFNNLEKSITSRTVRPLGSAIVRLPV